MGCAGSKNQSKGHMYPPQPITPTLPQFSSIERMSYKYSPPNPQPDKTKKSPLAGTAPQKTINRSQKQQKQINIHPLAATSTQKEARVIQIEHKVPGEKKESQIRFQQPSPGIHFARTIQSSNDDREWIPVRMQSDSKKKFNEDDTTNYGPNLGNIFRIKVDLNQ